MKAELTNFPNYILILTPENKDEQNILKEAVGVIKNGRMISSRGFKYMSEDV